jgi:hypothetical protein
MNKRFRGVISCLLFLGSGAFPQRAGGRVAPTAVQLVRGKYCVAYAPQGWRVTAENPQRIAFGADMLSGNGLAHAGFSVSGGGATAARRGVETPDRVVANSLSAGGRWPTRFGVKKQLGPNVFLIDYQNSVSRGVVWYEVFPAFVIVARQANSAPGAWDRVGAEASAVARSMHCNVPSVAPAPDPPGLNPKPKSKPAGDTGKSEDDSLYNQWLDKEYYHNSETGENFWVRPSHDWVKDGPEGPGYYAQHGNRLVKLVPGYSQ